MRFKFYIGSQIGPKVMNYKPRYLLFLDIDGTVVVWTAREQRMEQEGLVIGKYGESNRMYPMGYDAFINGFNNPELFHLDTNIPEAEELIDTAHEAGATVIFLTARDAIHHCSTESRLKQRRLWREGIRLILQTSSKLS